MRQPTLALATLRTIARLVRDQHAIRPEGPDPVMETLNDALDILSAEWDTDI